MATKLHCFGSGERKKITQKNTKKKHDKQLEAISNYNGKETNSIGFFFPSNLASERVNE